MLSRLFGHSYQPFQAAYQWQFVDSKRHTLSSKYYATLGRREAKPALFRVDEICLAAVIHPSIASSTVPANERIHAHTSRNIRVCMCEKNLGTYFPRVEKCSSQIKYRRKSKWSSNAQVRSSKCSTDNERCCQLSIKTVLKLAKVNWNRIVTTQHETEE